MGISTFLHVVSDAEAAKMAEQTDDQLVAVVKVLCQRGFVGSSAKKQEDDKATSIRELLGLSPKDETTVLLRCDLDRCGATVTHCLSKLLQIRKSEEDELLTSLLDRTKSIGSCVGAYGPLSYISAQQVDDLWKQHLEPFLSANSLTERVENLFDNELDSFPDVLGGMCDVSHDDLEYVQYHLNNCVAMIQHANENGSGLLVHFW